MTKKERVERMLSGKKIDYFPSHLEFVPDRLNCLLKEKDFSMEELNKWACNHFFMIFPFTESCYFSSGSYEDEQLIDSAVKKGLIPPHPDERLLYDNFHVAWKKNPVGVREVEHPLEGSKDLDSFDWPDPTVDGIFDHLKEELEDHRKEYYIVGLHHLLLVERAYLLVGYENLLKMTITDTRFVEDLLDRIVEYQKGLARRFIDLGVDAVRTGDDYGAQSGPMMNPGIWRKLFKPRLAEIWKVYQNEDIKVMLHTDGDVSEFIPDFIELGLDVLHPVQPRPMDLEEIANQFGHRIAFFGGVDTQQILPFGDPEDVMKAVRHCVETLGRNGRYIIAPSQEVMYEVPTENIEALVKGIRKYRNLY